MPQFLEKILKGEAKQRGFRGKKAAAYVYGTMNNIGAIHGHKETANGTTLLDVAEESPGDVPRHVLAVVRFLPDGFGQFA